MTKFTIDLCRLDDGDDPPALLSFSCFADKMSDAESMADALARFMNMEVFMVLEGRNDKV